MRPKPAPDALFNQFIKDPAYPALVACLNGLELPADTVYAVGGLLRDWLLYESLSPDLDLVVPAPHAEAVSRALSEQFGTTFISLFPEFGIYRVIVPSALESGFKVIDIAQEYGGSLEADLNRRDMTVNAMAMNLADGTWVDPHGGQVDIEQRRIRMVSAENLQDDPLRYLRLFRMAAMMGTFSLDEATRQSVVAAGANVVRAAPERIHYEFCRLLAQPHCFAALEAMHQTGLLSALFPEWTPLRQVPPNQYHHLPLPEHTLALLEQLEVFAKDAQWPPTLTDAMAEDSLTVTSPWVACRLACLFHDLGKPATMEYDPAEDRYRFYGHELVSAQQVEGIAVRMKWSRSLTQSVWMMVRWHLYPHQVMGDEVTDKAKRRFFKRLKEDMPGILWLAIADRYSTLGPLVTDDALLQTKTQLASLWNEYEAYCELDAQQPPLLNGRDVMDLLAIQPGPKIGEVLDQLRDAQLSGDVISPEAARQWVLAHH